jgi:hypothetical protein
MTAYTWTGASGRGSGNWDSPTSWSPAGGPPTATDTATISLTKYVDYNVIINSADAAQTLIEDAFHASVADVGSLTISNTFALEQGTFILNSGGILNAAHIRIDGGAQQLFLVRNENSTTIDATVTNNGGIRAVGGTLDFKRQVIGRGLDSIGGQGNTVMEFEKEVGSPQDVEAGRLQDVTFNVPGPHIRETLDLLDPQEFFGVISDVRVGDIVNLAGDWTFSGLTHSVLTHPTGLSTDLLLSSSGHEHKFEFYGDLTRSDFHITSGTNTTITFKLT